MPQITFSEKSAALVWIGKRTKKERRGLHKQTPAQVLCELGAPAPFSSLGEPDWQQDGRAASASPHLQWQLLPGPGTGDCTALRVHCMKWDHAPAVSTWSQCPQCAPQAAWAWGHWLWKAAT